MTESGTGVPGYVLRAYRGAEDHSAMAAVRAGSAEHDRVDPGSVVEGLPDAEAIGTESAALADPARDQVLIEHGGAVVGYAAVRWWRERDGTWLYLHRGHLLPGHRGRGVGSAMLAWAEEHVRGLVAEQGTAATAVFGANAMAGEREAARLLTDTGYRRVFSLVELELPDLGALPDAGEPPPGIRIGPVGPDDYRAAWRTVVDSYRDAAFTEEWPYERFLAKADPACWRAAWQGEEMAGVALCSLRAGDRTTGEVEELSVRAGSRRLGLGRAVLLAGLRSLREHGATSARLYTGTANPHRSYDLYESVGFRRRNEYVRYRKPLPG
ncbi:GNAT family N-acetyltransferase [Streptomyces sp. SID7909]|uniref:GNAT family N-acetyltransferase n=1 Tax=Streptomyces sp. SID7909 TaxID=2706092 RepID=UPI0013BC7B25|nr:GNAT family N-acetyltransferase [Streptomyces sp. SID7909]NEC09676.1 GNAT family N-acetyltransferase [Streptomyces sp. SID7909]